VRILVLVLLLLGAHFSLTPFAPAQAGKARFYWPFAADSRSILSRVGGLPSQSGSIVTPLLGGLAGLCFLAAVPALFSVVVPASWWPFLVAVGSVASILLYVLYLGPNSLLPIAIDLVLLWGVLIQHWTVAALRGG